MLFEKYPCIWPNDFHDPFTKRPLFSMVFFAFLPQTFTNTNEHDIHLKITVFTTVSIFYYDVIFIRLSLQQAPLPETETSSFEIPSHRSGTHFIHSTIWKYNIVYTSSQKNKVEFHKFHNVQSVFKNPSSSLPA